MRFDLGWNRNCIGLRDGCNHTVHYSIRCIYLQKCFRTPRLLPIEPLEEGGYLATSPAWEDLLAQGRTIAETIEIAQDVARRLLESYIAHGDPLPAMIQDLLAQKQPTFYIPIAVPVVV